MMIQSVDAHIFSSLGVCKG